MGYGHLTPSNNTLKKRQKVVDYEGCHADITQFKEEFEVEHSEKAVINSLTKKYGFEELYEHEWLTNNEKVVAKTDHGAELRAIYHPTGTTVYYFITVTKDFYGQKQNLALSHMHSYGKYLKSSVKEFYDTCRIRTGRKTSKKAEIKEE